MCVSYVILSENVKCVKKLSLICYFKKCVRKECWNSSKIYQISVWSPFCVKMVSTCYRKMCQKYVILLPSDTFLCPLSIPRH